MDRRKFLKGLLGTTAVAVVGVDVGRKYDWHLINAWEVKRYRVVLMGEEFFIKESDYAVERLAA